MQFADHIWPFKYVFLWFFNKSIYEIKVYEFYTEYHGFFFTYIPRWMGTRAVFAKIKAEILYWLPVSILC